MREGSTQQLGLLAPTVPPCSCPGNGRSLCPTSTGGSLPQGGEMDGAVSALTHCCWKRRACHYLLPSVRYTRLTADNSDTLQLTLSCILKKNKPPRGLYRQRDSFDALRRVIAQAGINQWKFSCSLEVISISGNITLMSMFMCYHSVQPIPSPERPGLFTRVQEGLNQIPVCNKP